MSTRTLQKGATSRLVPKARAGISKKSNAPYWRGERCEAVVEARVASYPTRSSRAGNGTSSRKAKTPNQQLRRLERNLARRKTLEARQRIQRQIDQLREELDRA